MRRYIRVATPEEVLEATPNDSASRAVTLKNTPFTVWLFDVEEIAKVGVQHPSGPMGTIASLYNSWVQWIGVAAEEERQRYYRQLSLVQQRRVFNFRPILIPHAQNPAQIHDGKHRLFAAYECRGAIRELTVEVFARL